MNYPLFFGQILWYYGENSERKAVRTLLHLLLGTDWTANRDEILDRISREVKNEKTGRILMVPELISHEAERRLCETAGFTVFNFLPISCV